MRKSKIFLLLGVFTLLCALVFSVIATEAALENEATLTVSSQGSTTTEKGTLQQMLNKLATASPTAATTYKITLSSDASYTSPVILNGVKGANGLLTVEIDLAGYTLTSTANAPLLYVSGAIARIDINGNFNKDGERGRIVCDEECGAIIFVENNEYTNSSDVNIKNLDAVYTNLSNSNAQAIIDVRNGKLKMENTVLTYDGVNAVIKSISERGDLPVVGEGDIGGEQVGNLSTLTVPLVNAEYATVTLKDCFICDKTGYATDTADTRALMLTGCRAYVQNTVLLGKYGVYTTSSLDPSQVLLVDSEITGFTNALYYGRSTSEITVLGGILTTGGTDIANSLASDLNLNFYYGNGVVVKSSASPNKYFTQENCFFNETSDGFVLYTSVTDAAMCTVATVGDYPQVSTGNLDAMITISVGNFASTPLVEETAYVVTVLKDTTIAPAAEFVTNSYHNFLLDFNGYTVTTSKRGHLFNYKGDFYFTVDGADVNGNKGTLVSNYDAQSLVFAKRSDNKLHDNLRTVTRLENLKFHYTCLSSNGQQMLYLVAGTHHFNGLEFTYTGENGPDAGAEKKFIEVGNANFDTTPTLFMTDCIFIDTNTKGILTKAMQTTTGARVFANEITIDGLYNGFEALNTSTLNLKNSTVKVDNACYIGSSGASINVYDTESRTESGNLTENGNEKICFYYGNGKNVVYVGEGNSLAGNYGAEDGYILAPNENGAYMLFSGSMTSTVSMPTIFADGMVFQRGKEFNVFGFCESNGATIECKLGDQTVHATVENGEWCATFQPMDAQFNLTLTVEELNCAIPRVFTFKKVNVGEVWVVMGQSNAATQANRLEDFDEYLKNADNFKNVRLYTQKSSYLAFEDKLGQGKWYELGAETVKNQDVSAVGYVAIMKLAAELGEDVPIAIIHACQTSSKIVSWISMEETRALSSRDLTEYGLTSTERDQLFNGISQSKDQYHGTIKSMANAEAFALYQKTYGSLPSDTAGSESQQRFKELTGMDYPGRPDKVSTGSLYNGKLAHMKGFVAKGYIWYQGEGDAGTGNVNTYPVLYDALQNTIASVFGNGERLPGFVVQLAPYGTTLASNGAHTQMQRLANFRNVQQRMCEERDNLYLVTTSLDGSPFSLSDLAYGPGPSFIHPSRKSTVGIRCAHLMLKNIYGIGENEVTNYPVVQSVKYENGKVIITYDTDIYLTFSNEALGFELYQNGSWVSAVGRVEGNKVILNVEGSGAVTTVRYAYGYPYIELRDGTLLHFNGASYKQSNGTTSIGYTYIYDTESGQTYKFVAHKGDSTRMLIYGNISNASGDPAPAFTATID